MNARHICVIDEGADQRGAGELLDFDTSVEHEAWNNGTSDRIILIFDIWRPELSEEERRAITAMFEATDSYSR